MKTKSFVCVFFAFFLFQACSKKSAADFNSDFSLFKEYISSFSSGIVPAKTDIRVVLAFNSKDLKANKVLSDDLFDISPSVDGKVVALSNNTIAFIPEKKLKQDTEYQITFHLSKLKKVPEEMEDFHFTIKTIKQDFVVEPKDVQSYNKEYQYLNCVLRTADLMPLETAVKLVTAKYAGQGLKIKFDNAIKEGKEFKFIIDSIHRQSTEGKLEINYDGDAADIDSKGTIDYNIAALGDFKIMTTELEDDGEHTLLINFSDPLLKVQDFRGLVYIENAKNLKFSTQGNLLKVFFNNEKPTTPEPVIVTTVTDTTAAVAAAIIDSTAVDTTAAVTVANYNEENATDLGSTANQLIGELKVYVFQGIESEYGQKMTADYSTKIVFGQLKPKVEVLQNGTIMPSSGKFRINFQAVNLKAVDVRIFKIYKNNILQFLQDNQLNGARNLRQVGQPVAKTTLDLKQNPLVNLSKWNTFALDLSKIITPDPGAIYRVEFVYKKEYSVYKCDSVETDENQNEDAEEENENDVNYSNGGDYDYEYYYDEDYDWREQEDPCTNSYYYNNKVGTNILATDLGVIAKRGENKSYFFAVNNIVTTAPVSGAKVELYSYQQQKLATETTNGDGIVNFQLDKFAYFAIVTKGDNTTYIKLDDGLSLSVSNFDVAGEELQKGLKGYIYGERGVWRPGDNLYLSFILNDEANKLPKSHPIKFRLSDPNGKVTYQTVQKSNEMNHYAFVVPTNADAPTGSWEAVVTVGGARFYKNIKIETIKPNRLRVKNNFNKAILSAVSPNIANLEVTWLHGAVAKNLKVEMQAKFSQQETSFKNYPKYTFDDLVREFDTEEISIFSGKLDANGRASVNIQPKLQAQAPGMLKAAFITKVYEEGGDFSTDVIVSTYSPYSTYVGIKAPEPSKYGALETGKVNKFDIITVGENGRPRSVSNLEVKVFKVEWRWWWDASNDNLSNYNSGNSTTAFKTYNISTDGNGKGSIAFSVTDDEWGRYLIRVVDPIGGHATAQTALIDWPYWSGKTRNTDATTANMLVFSTDKKNYAVGEKAKISFPSSEGGRALISIENGTKVLQSLWAETEKGETKVEIPITAEMAPNVYLHITLLQPHATTKNDSPIRMYGIVPIEVVDKNTILEPKIAMPAVLKPEQTFALKVSEKNGRAMTYTIAIVDEGLLDLTRFKTPNAWDSFYVREALGVKTWDVYDDVIGAYGGKVNQIFSIGGDQDLGGGKAKKANRFKPVVVYLGPFVLPAGDSKIHNIKLPKYIGSVRTMVVAADAKTSAYGSIEKATPVRSPLMVLASLPRKISPSEKVTIPVTVFAMEKNVKNVTIQIKTNNGLRIIGSPTQTVNFTQPDEKMVYYNLEVGSATGIGKLQVIATSGKEKSTYDVEIDMVNPNPITNTFKDVVLEPNSTKTLSWATFGVAGSNKASIEFSSMPTIDLNRRLNYLISYPHGCVEQTTSSVFPQLFLSDVADLDVSRISNIQKNVTAGISRLSGFQLANGGFTYWPGMAYADDWGTSYAGHFLTEAEKKGYLLPVNCKSKWISYQQKEAKLWRFQPQYGNDLAQAYRLYTLALAGAPDLPSMNRLRETNNISNESKLRLAAAYVLAGQKAAGASLLAKTNIDEEGGLYNYYYYGSFDRNRAMALETLILLGQKPRAFAMAQKVAKDMAADQWMSTQTTAYCLYAMSKFAQSNGSKGLDVQFTQSGKGFRIVTAKSFADRALVVKPGTNGVTIKNNKNNTIYVRVLSSGILPIGQEQVVQNSLSANVVFKNRKGAVVNVTKIAQGTEFIAEVTIRNQRNERVENVALSQILPSGFEIVNTRFTDYGDATNNNADYIDIRDDRTNFYFSLKANEAKTFKVLLNASYLGKYYLPGLQCEAMYDHTYLARTKGQWIDIVK
ncbi:MAG: MG2 domain-containing protein [Flavobacterium sp.]|nr:MG2 domain-containing protein [Flavobacterium sp.]